MSTPDTPSELLFSVRIHAPAVQYLLHVCERGCLSFRCTPERLSSRVLACRGSHVLFDPLLAVVTGGDGKTLTQLNVRRDERRAFSMCFSRTPST